jgi:geranylgeranyl diphosphate synthase type II
MGAILAGAQKRELDKLTTYSAEFGMAFQITDDILDATGTTEEIGKDVEHDAFLNRTNYVLSYGLDGARDEAQKAVNRARAALAGLPNAEFHELLVEYLLARRS